MIYFDNSSTTKVKNEVNDFVYKRNITNFGNPSSLHRLGIDSEKTILEAKRVIADIINASNNEIYFTSGGTEANNTALIGAALRYQNRGKHIITSQIEHASVLNSFKHLESLGFEVTYLKPDSKGIILDMQVLEALRGDTILVSIMHVNNEIGTIQNIEKIGELLKSRKQIVFHVDAIQSYGKLKIDVKKYGIDLLSISGHKIHAFKGIGALYIRKGISLKPILFGGQQEKGIRPGTENMPGIASLLKASEIVKENMEKYYTDVKSIKEYIVSKLIDIEGVVINSDLEDNLFSPYILNVSFEGLRGEVLLHALEERGLYVSTGSACNSKKKHVSYVLEAIKVDKKFINGTIRLSFSSLNTMEEAKKSILIIKESVDFLNKIMKRGLVC